jgi:hypothetical protein
MLVIFCAIYTMGAASRFGERVSRKELALRHELVISINILNENGFRTSRRVLKICSIIIIKYKSMRMVQNAHHAIPRPRRSSSEEGEWNFKGSVC